MRKLQPSHLTVLFIDDNLTWNKHVDEISKKISSGIGALKRLRPFIPLDTAVTLYKALIQPYFEYCSSVWDGLSGQLSDKLQKLQNRAARTITRSSYNTRSAFLRNLLGWESLDIVRKRQKAIMVFKALNGLAPSYLENLFYRACHSYSLRNVHNSLSLHKLRTDFMKKKFYVQWSLFVEQPPRGTKSYRLLRSIQKKYKKAHYFTGLQHGNHVNQSTILFCIFY